MFYHTTDEPLGPISGTVTKTVQWNQDIKSSR